VLAHTMQHENKDFRVFRVFRGLFSKEFPCGIPHQRGWKGFPQRIQRNL